MGWVKEPSQIKPIQPSVFKASRVNLVFDVY